MDKLRTTEPMGLCGRFPFISHKSNPWKTGTKKMYQSGPLEPQIMRVTIQAKKARNLLWTSEPQGLWCRIPCISHKSNPWKNRVYESVQKHPPSTSNNASYKQKNHKFYSKPLSKIPENGNQKCHNSRMPINLPSDYATIVCFLLEYAFHYYYFEPWTPWKTGAKLPKNTRKWAPKMP